VLNVKTWVLGVSTLALEKSGMLEMNTEMKVARIVVKNAMDIVDGISYERMQSPQLCKCGGWHRWQVSSNANGSINRRKSNGKKIGEGRDCDSDWV